MDVCDVVINTFGTRFYLDESTIRQIPESCLENAKIKVYNNGGGDIKEYYINCHVETFKAISWYYENGELHMPPSVCPSVFKKDLELLHIDPSYISRCCYMKYVSFFENQSLLESFEDKDNFSTSFDNCPETKLAWHQRIKKKGWVAMNFPSSSKVAKIYTIISTLAILLSIFVLCASTHPSFQRNLELDEWEEYYKGNDAKVKDIQDVRKRRTDRLASRKITALGKQLERCYSANKTGNINDICTNKTISKLERKINRQRKRLSYSTNCTECTDNLTTEFLRTLPESTTVTRYSYLHVIDEILFAYFFIELLIRFLFCPRKRKFLCNVLNTVDFIAVLSQAITLAFTHLYPKEKYKPFSPIDIVECIAIARVFRIFRIVKNSTGFRVIFYSVKASYKNMALNVFLLLAFSLIFSTIGYYCDRKQFRSIPDAIWWAVITMTTVGYGDMYPTTVLGKVVGCLCAISGVFILAVLIPVFVQNFLLVLEFARTENVLKSDRRRKLKFRNEESVEMFEKGSI